MDIYQCMTCGERWAHGTEQSVKISEEHQSNGHHVSVGDIDVLAAAYASREHAHRAAITPPVLTSVPNPAKPELPPNGNVTMWGHDTEPVTRRQDQMPEYYKPQQHQASTEQEFRETFAVPQKESRGVFVAREFKNWLLSDENSWGFEAEVGRYLSSSAWRYLMIIIDSLPRS